jgi:2-polyprenyl-3-methyl-5-hydroxy-6-metoxy-1,4-benzoquinol methylase
MIMDPRHETNRRRWDELTPVHRRSAFYDVPGFLAGRNTLFEIERTGVGDVRGQSLLHLQCHFGLDSLSWARLGANVVGVDFSETAITEARALAEKSGLASCCRFVCADVLELDRHLHDSFDVVFTSYGVITWLSDLHRWAEVIARFLKPGGLFFMAEIHPFAFIFRENTATLEVAYDYFHDSRGIEIENTPDYADPAFVPAHSEYYWAWSLADVFHALRAAGLELQDFREYPFSCYRQFPQMEQRSDGRWFLPHGSVQIPLLYSVTARKP